MSDTFARQETMLAEALATAIRGPRRNGLFAVWLVLRCCGDVLPTNRVSHRAHRRRVDALEHRLHGLSLPPPLRRALIGALRHLSEDTPQATSIALQQLVAPVHETLGSGAGDAVAGAARVAQNRVRNIRIR